MLKRGIINADLLAGLAQLRHTDTLVVSDAGLPVPPGITVIDLALTYGKPGFSEVLKAITDQIVVEGAVMATEGKGTPAEQWVAEAVSAPLRFVPHEGPGGLKDLVRSASLLVRTGEDTPYANVILRSGVPF